MKVKIDQKLSWLEPFLKLADEHYPELIRTLSWVRARKPNLSREMSYAACCVPLARNKYGINLMTKYHTRKTVSYDKKGHAKVIRSYADYSRLDLLHNLAHEIAHLKYWDHTPSRLILECEILIEFMALLTDFGYVSEEAEFTRI